MRTVRLREVTRLVHVAALGLTPGGLGPRPRLLLLACELTGNAAGGDVKCLHCDEQALIVCQPQIPYSSRRLMEEPARPGQEEPVGLGGQAEPGRAARLPCCPSPRPGPPFRVLGRVSPPAFPIPSAEAMHRGSARGGVAQLSAGPSGPSCPPGEACSPRQHWGWENEVYWIWREHGLDSEMW